MNFNRIKRVLKQHGSSSTPVGSEKRSPVGESSIASDQCDFGMNNNLSGIIPCKLQVWFDGNAGRLFK